MVKGTKINQVSEGGVEVSIWTAVDPAKNHHDDFQVEVGALGDDDWVCVGGGGTGHKVEGNYLTASFPSNDFKVWNIRSRDHIDPDSSTLTGFAIGLRIPGLSKDDLKANLKIFRDTGNFEQHPEQSAFIEDGFILVGGGFHIIDQPEGGGNMSTGSFPDSNISWRASSKDHFIPTLTRLQSVAIGIRPTLKKADGTVFGSVTTMYHSFQLLPGNMSPESTVKPLKGMALCGGGAAAHWSQGFLIWSLEPTPIVSTQPNKKIIPSEQSFTGRAKNGQNHFPFNPVYSPDSGPITAYAMGMKFTPSSSGPPPPPVCDRLIPIIEAKSVVTLNPNLPEDNVKDGKLDTKWMSTNTQNPSIRLSLQEQKPICKVDIAWADGDARVYKFFIEVSTDNQNWGTPVFTGQSLGNTTGFESYQVNGNQASWVRITVTDSGLGSPTGNSQAQISEIRVFSNV